MRKHSSKIKCLKANVKELNAQIFTLKKENKEQEKALKDIKFEIQKGVNDVVTKAKNILNAIDIGWE